MSTQEEQHSGSVSTGVHTALRDPRLQIRLLRLDADSDGDTVSASLEVWDKEAAPHYNAISYVCGDPELRQDVTVNSTRVSVRQNCYYALWQTRLHYPESRVWIDAICINQLNLEEKTAQVTMMHEIYSRAVQVLACIGPSDVHSDVVTRAIHDLDTFVQPLPMTWWQEPINMDVWDPPLDETSAARFLDHYNEFSKRPYFTRVWVLQELAAGHNRTMLLCGRDISHWSDLAQLAHRLYLMYSHGSDGPYEGARRSRRIFDMEDVVIMQDYDVYEFLRYLKTINQLHCQDVRDRVYSTSALVDWGSFGHRPPVPDYRISRVELALQLIGKMVDTSLNDVEIIARTLDLWNPATMSQILQEVFKWRLDNKSHTALIFGARKWSVQLLGAQMVQQDATGRAGVHLEQLVPRSSGSITRQSRHRPRPNVPGLSGKSITACTPASEYVGEVLAAVASGSMQVGDIVVQSRWFDLVLRPHDEGDKFVIVEDAHIPNGCQLARKAPFVDECGCHWRSLQNYNEYETVFIHIAMELSDEEVLAAVISRKAMEDGYCDGSEYLNGDDSGHAKAGSHVWDATTEQEWQKDRVGIGKPSCGVHTAGEYYWRSQKFFWYSVLMGTGCILAFPRTHLRRSVV